MTRTSSGPHAQSKGSNTMANNTTATQETQDTRTEKAERLDVYTIRNGEKLSIWTRIGAAFVNRDGSINVYLDALPVDGKLHIRKAAIRGVNDAKAAA